MFLDITTQLSSAYVTGTPLSCPAGATETPLSHVQQMEQIHLYSADSFALRTAGFPSETHLVRATDHSPSSGSAAKNA